MNRKNLMLIGLLFCLALTAIVPVMAQTPEPPPALAASTELYATSNFVRANVRSGPSRLYTTLGQVRLDDALDITGRLANDTWLRVNFNGQEGWISAALFDITGDLTTAPVAEAGPNAVLRTTASQSNSARLNTVVVITRVDANLRATASVNANVLSVIPFSTTLTVTGRTEGNNWMQVSYNGQTGWLSSATLVFTQGNTANLPVLDENGSPVTTSTK